MKIANQFTVSAPIEQAWDVLCDLEQVIPLMPGAQIRWELHLHAVGEQIRDQILASPEVADYLRSIWLQLRDWLRDYFPVNATKTAAT